MPKVNGHRYNIVYNTKLTKDTITDDTLFAIYYASDDRHYNTKDSNRAFEKVYTLSELRDLLLYFPAKDNLRLRLRPRKTNKRRQHKRQIWHKRQTMLNKMQAKMEKIQAKLTELREKC